MAFQIGQALGRGTRRSLSVSGIVLLVSMLLYQIAFIGALNTVISNFLNDLPEEAATTGAAEIGFSFPIPTSVAAIIGGVALLFGTVVFFLAARLLSRDLSELGSVPGELVSHRFFRALLTTLAVSLISGIIIVIGLVMLIVPGLFFAVSFQFAIYAVAVEDRGPIDALGRSWELASGNRWKLFGLVILIAVISGIGTSIGTVVSLGNPMAGEVVSLVFNSVFAILTYGILADAFVQLREEPTTESTTVSGTEPL